MEATVTLSDQSGVAEARRQTRKLVASLDLSEKLQADAALVVTEAATNILKYAGSGEIVLRRVEDGASNGLDIIALDRGAGITNLDVALADGYSTGGSLGAGLGTIARHSSTFDLYSIPGDGTAVFARLVEGKSTTQRHYAVGARSTAKRGQEICGDAWSMRFQGPDLWITLLDGLGHGPLASLAAQEGVRSFHAAGESNTPEDIIRAAHRDIRATRGAVMAVAKFDAAAHTVSFAGVGNIVAGVRRGDDVTHLLSTDGTVGYNMRTIRPSTVKCGRDSVFIASTDGLSTRWNLNKHPGLLQKHPSLIAAVLHRDFSRDSDDATVIVVKAVQPV